MAQKKLQRSMRAPDPNVDRSGDPVDTRRDRDPVDPDHDVNTRAILRFALALAVGLAAVLAGVTPLSHWLTESEADIDHAPAPMSTELSRVPPDPRLQPNPRVQLQELRAYESEHLGSYGWVDRDAGVVHIPLERAMQLVAKRGLPVRPESARPQDPDIAMPTESSLGIPARAGGPAHGERAHGADEGHAPEHGTEPAHDVHEGKGGER